ncbi:MAG: hypothetical protein AAEJ52_18050, partial [Myxococcota bacterium]
MGRRGRLLRRFGYPSNDFVNERLLRLVAFAVDGSGSRLRKRTDYRSAGRSPSCGLHRFQRR